MVHFSISPGPAAVAIDDAANICKTNACTFEVILLMQSLKNPEEFIRICHVKSHAVVADEDCDLGFIFPFVSDLDLCNRPRTSELQCVRNQIGHHYSQHGLVTGNTGQ